MIQLSTQDLLTLYIYGEATPAQQAELAAALNNDSQLREQFDEMVAAQKALNQKLMSPSATSIDLIMRHSLQSEELQEI